MCSVKLYTVRPQIPHASLISPYSLSIPHPGDLGVSHLWKSVLYTLVGEKTLYLTLELKDAVLTPDCQFQTCVGSRELTISASEVGGHPGT